MVSVQKWPFFKLFFQAKQARKMSFLIIQNEKNVFLGYKNIKFKSGKIDILPNGLTHCFGPKMAIFPFFFFLGIIDQENVFYDILQQKIAFLGYKNIKFKKLKFDIFRKVLTHVFGPKMAIFPTFFFRQYRPAKCLLSYSRTKKRHSRL